MEGLNSNVLNSLMSHIAVIDKAGVITYTNKAWDNFYKVNRKSLINEKSGIGDNYLERCLLASKTSKDALKSYKGIQQVINGEIEYFKTKYSVNEQEWYSINVNLLDEQRVLIIHENITDQILANQEIVKNEARISKLFETASEGIITVGKDGLITMVNEAVEVIFGYRKQELLNEPLVKLIPPTSKGILTKHIVDFFKNPSVRKIGESKQEVFGVRKNGEVFPIGVALSHIEVNGEKLAVAFVEDLTEITKVKKEIENQRDLLLKSHKMSNSGTWEWDVKTNVVSWDDMLYEIFELEKSVEPNFESYINSIVDKDREFAVQSIEEALKDKASFSSQYSINTFKNNIKHIRTFGKVELDNDGEVVKMIGVCMDVTKIKNDEILFKTISEIASTLGGKEYFEVITQILSKKLNIKYAFVGKYNPEKHSISTLGYSVYGKLQDNMTYLLKDTPCDFVMGGDTCVYSKNVQSLFPKDDDLKKLGVESYLGLPLYRAGVPMGIMVLMSEYPLDNVIQKKSVLRTISTRTETELERLQKEEEIKDINEKLNVVIAGTNTGVWEWNLITNNVKFNKEWGALLGYDENEIRQDFSMWEENVHPDDIEEATKRIAAYLKGEKEEYSYVHRMKHKNGDWVHILTQGVISKRDENGQPTYFIGTHTDVNKQERYLKEIIEYEKYFSMTIDLMCIQNFEGQFIKINNKFTEVLGYTEEELLTQSFTRFVHADDLKKTNGELEKLVTGETTIGFTNRYKCKDGKYKYLMWSVIPDIKTKLLYSAARDITEKILMEQEKSFAIMKAEEMERKRIAYDLHDGLGQKISAVNMYINALDEPVRNQLDEDTLSIFKVGKKLINEAAKEIRLVSHNIVPRSLDGFGLERSISGMLSDYQKINKDVTLILDSNLDNTRYNEDYELAVFRMVQELINNALKHSKSKKIQVVLKGMESGLFVEVNDDGIGFDIKELGKVKETGIGLISLEQRIKMIGGELNIDSKLLKGTTVTMTIPVNV